MVSLKKMISPQTLEEFCASHHIKKIALFGSALTGTMREDSDIDLLVYFEEGHAPGLLGMAGMEIELTNLLGRKADLRTEKELSIYFRDEVIAKAEVQYGR